GVGDVTTFTWDYRNRLTEAKRTVGAQVSDDLFSYDVWDRRIGKSINGVQTWTVYDGANPYADYDGSTWTRYLYGTAVDQLFARYHDDTNGVQWYLADRLGTVRQIVNASGTVLDQITYDSFGNIPPGGETNPSNGDRFKFTGREWDAEIGQHYYRARYYSPAVGRFESEDPIGFGGGDANFYRYVKNGPTNGTDSTGLYEEDIHFYMTYFLARAVGFCDEDAYDIAWANHYTDYNPITRPDRLGEAGTDIRKKLHFRTSGPKV